MTKFILLMVLCSGVAQNECKVIPTKEKLFDNTCLEPHVWPTTFNTQYDCLMYGYEESLNKMKEIGAEDVNKYNMFIKFNCTPSNII
jgi:hypothetical protein